MNDSERGHFLSSNDLKKESYSFQKGWKNAQKIDKKSRDIKI